MSSSASPFAAWFDAPEHADLLIDICTGSTTEPEPCAKKAKTGTESQASGSGAAAAAQAARSYHCHAIVLSAYSGYFKAQLSSTWQPRHPEEPSSSSSAAGAKRPVSVNVEPEELEAMHELLRMMYTQALPTTAATGDPFFLQCLRLADRFQAASCMELLLTALAAIPSEDVDCAVLGYVFQTTAGVEVAPSYPALLASSTKALLRLFGDVPKVIQDGEALLQQFCALPHAAVLAWVQSHELQVDSENCVVFLLSAWVKANQDSTAAQHEQLAHQIRVFHLGPTYLHQVLPNLSWFKGCSGMKHLTAVQCCVRAGVTTKEGREKQKRACHGLGCPTTWMALPRRSSNNPRTGSWVLGASQLKEMDRGTRQYLSPPVYVNGFLMSVCVSPKVTSPAAATPGKTLGASLGVDRSLMERRGLPMPDNTMLPIDRVRLRVGSPGIQISKEGDIGAPCISRCDMYRGINNFLGRSAPTIAELVAPYLRKGQLQVEATFTRVDVVIFT